MKELTIEKMKVSDILRKKSFSRMMPAPYDTPNKGGSDNYDANASHGKPQYCYPTQDDFMREYYVTSHSINSIAYYPNLFCLDKSERKVKAKIRSRVSVALQQYIHTRRLIAITGFDPDVTTASRATNKETEETLKAFKEGWAVKGLDNIIHQAISDDLKVGDVAVCGSKDIETGFSCRVFSFCRGDILYPHFNPITGKVSLFGRKFSDTFVNANGTEETVNYLDVWDDTHYIQYRHLTSYESSQVNSGTIDGEWVVSHEATPHNFRRCPIAYHRYGAPCWANSQSLIDEYELALSQLAENNAQYALRILYTLGADFEMEGTTDGTPTRIDSIDPNAKVGFLEPADSSKSFELQLTSLYKNILRSSSVVETPEIKNGSDVSSLTIKMMFADSYQQALADAKEYQPFLDDVRDMYIEGHGTYVNMVADFRALCVVIKLQPWVFQSETEVVNALVQLSSVGVLSKRSSTEISYEQLGYGAVDEVDRIRQEAHDEIAMSNDSSLSDNPVNQARNAE